MHPINQRSHPPAFAAKVRVLVFLSWILILPVPVEPADVPPHTPQYDQLQNGIADISKKIARTGNTVRKLKGLRGSPSPRYDELHKEIQDLTDKIAVLKTQVYDHVAKDSTLTADLEALSKRIGAGEADTDLIRAISELSAKVVELTAKITSIGENKKDQDFSWKEIVKSITIPLSVTFLALWLFDKPKQQRERAKERLEKFYAPVLGRLRVNKIIWNDFTSNNDILNQEERARIEKNGHVKPEDIVKDILATSKPNSTRSEDRLNTWVAAMEGIFRQNNEAAEKTILENFGLLRPEDVDPTSKFFEKCDEYLKHVGEFKAVLHHWAEARTAKHSHDTSWLERCQTWASEQKPDKTDCSASTSHMMSSTANEQDPNIENCYGYFHPSNTYPRDFDNLVEESYKKLMKEAGLEAKQISRLLDKWRKGVCDRLHN